MAGAVVDRVWRTTTPDRVEADLADLWRELAAGGGRVARAVMSNLVVFRDRRVKVDADPSAMLDGLPLDEVAARHPSRTIVLEHCHDEAERPPFAAGVGVVTFGPPQARYGVEQIVVRSACPNQALLSLLRRFVRGDLPTSVWWTAEMSAVPTLEPFVEVGRQLVFDSNGWREPRRGLQAVAAVIADERIDPADLNWRRLAPMRRALVEARGAVDSAAWQSVPVRIAAPAANQAIAWLCAGWLRAARGGTNRNTITVDSSAALSDAAVLLVVEAGGLTATLTARGAAVAGPTSLVAAAPVESQADAIAAELRSLARDASLVAALHAL